jgi:plastocyanin
MRRTIGAVAFTVIAGLSALALACSSGGGTAATSTAKAAAGPVINATLTEFTLKLDKSTAAPGALTITGQNKGTVAHELRVVKSDLAEDKLPIKDGAVDETQVTIAAKSAQFDAGKCGSATGTLTAGKYIVICNIPAHYTAGMHTALTVQ